MPPKHYPPRPKYVPSRTEPPTPWTQGYTSTPERLLPMPESNPGPPLQADVSLSKIWPSGDLDRVIWFRHGNSTMDQDASAPDLYRPGFRTQYPQISRRSHSSSRHQEPYPSQLYSGAGSSRLFTQDHSHLPQPPSFPSAFMDPESQRPHHSYDNLFVESSIAREQNSRGDGMSRDLDQVQSTARRQQAHCDSEKKRRE